MSIQNTFRPTIEFPWQRTRVVTREVLDLRAAGKAGRSMYFFAGIVVPLFCMVTGTTFVLFLNDSSGIFPMLTGIAVGGVSTLNRHRDRISAYEELLKSRRDIGM